MFFQYATVIFDRSEMSLPCHVFVMSPMKLIFSVTFCVFKKKTISNTIIGSITKTVKYLKTFRKTRDNLKHTDSIYLF